MAAFVWNVRALAAWSLGVSDEEIDATIARGTTCSVPLPEMIPTLLACHTRFPDEHGQIVSCPDIYGSLQATAMLLPSPRVAGSSPRMIGSPQ